VRLLDVLAARRHGQDRESGQATTEFALVLIPLLLLVVGVIQFGIALNYWLDMNRIANQGARWAVVNGWPGCPRTQTSPACTATPACSVNPPMSNTTLENLLKCQALTQGLRNSVNVSLCLPDDGDPSTPPQTAAVGTPVKVTLTSPYTFRAIMKLGTLNLAARATMRIESDKPVNHLSGLPTC
jgi:Flp pilus assembly protein TadG